MNEPTAAFEATFSDWKLVRSRKVVQLVFEVPVETSHLAYKVLGGMPSPAAEIWVAVARLDLKAIRQQQERDESTLNSGDNSTQQPASGGLPAPARVPQDPVVKKACTMCNDMQFQGWCIDKYDKGLKLHDHKHRETFAKHSIYRYCDVKSRKELTSGSAAGDKFLEMYSEFRNEHRI